MVSARFRAGLLEPKWLRTILDPSRELLGPSLARFPKPFFKILFFPRETLGIIWEVAVVEGRLFFSRCHGRPSFQI